jgi:uncharacterized protein YjiK
VTDETPPGAVGLAEPVEDPKRQKKEAKLRADAARGLDAWERYRALVDSLEEAMDLVELADRKARFALVIMGALNVAFFFVSTRTDLVNEVPLRLRPFLAFYLLLYAGVALFFFLEAIEALRPRRFRPHLPYPGEAGPEHYPEGLRYYEDIVGRDLEAYRRAWREVNFGRLNAELAVQNHVMARINLDKFRSLRRLYGGLRVLTVMAGGLLAIVAISMLLDAGSASPLAASGSRALPLLAAPAGAAADALPEPRPVALGVREGSGIAWHASRERLYVVGDRGTLVESRPSGEETGRWKVRGNLEDVTVHTPSGRVVLLAEKKGELVVFDPARGGETGRFPLDLPGVLDHETIDRNQGFEGLAFRPAASRPGGGVFYLVHQRKPARLVTIAFDPTPALRTIGAADVVGRSGMKKWEDLAAVTWCEPLSRLLVVAESRDRLLVVTPEGAIGADFGLPGGQQEGLAVTPDGALWIADERQGVLRIDGAVDWLRRGLARAAAAGSAVAAEPAR